MTISKFSVASVTATIFMAAFSTSTMAEGSLGPDEISRSAIVTITQPGVTGHEIVAEDSLSTSIASETVVARGTVTTSVADSVIGLKWTTGNTVGGMVYAFRLIPRDDGEGNLRIKATSVDGVYLPAGTDLDSVMRLGADGTSASYQIRVIPSGSYPLVAGSYTIGMRAATYIP